MGKKSQETYLRNMGQRIGNQLEMSLVTRKINHLAVIMQLGYKENSI